MVKKGLVIIHNFEDVSFVSKKDFSLGVEKYPSFRKLNIDYDRVVKSEEFSGMRGLKGLINEVCDGHNVKDVLEVFEFLKVIYLYKCVREKNGE